jgi:hypothetical protein
VAGTDRGRNFVEFAGPRILIERTETYMEASVRTFGIRPTSLSPSGVERGLRQVTASKQQKRIWLKSGSIWDHTLSATI